jgi:hypothetical protein
MYCHPDRSEAQRAQWRDLVFRAATALSSLHRKGRKEDTSLAINHK